MSSRLIPFDKIANEHPCFLDPEERPDWPGLFQNENPLKLEIGFGNGKFLLDMAIREPESNFIGMDFYHKGIRKVITRMDRLHLKNIRVVYGNAAEKIPILFKEAELSEVFINFPDPWPKKRHHKRRLIKPDFADTLAHKLEPQGKVRIATDFEIYAQEILEVMQSNPCFSNAHEEMGFLHQRDDIPKTKYEKSFLEAGKKIFYFDFSKVQDCELAPTA
ncbi:MAG: tRNA (guanosine(46)-N7)-methyltransferase TrmB [Nitrospinota bacterium]|nr:tRNA (guanosine(46)-N7)-methyltransferase TrmB [Nitrospinota bacterium]